MEWLESFKNSDNQRQDLLKMRDQFGDEYKELIIQHRDYFESLLKNEDSKLRKLVADVMAKTEYEPFKTVLFNTYFNESQQMIRASLLKSASVYDLSEYKSQLEEREAELILLQNGDYAKHAKEELHVLRKILQDYRVLSKHRFVGLHKEVPIILTIPAGHQEALMDELVGYDCKKVGLGVQVKTKDLQGLLENRLFTTMYFPLCKTSTMSIEDVASETSATKIVRFLDRCHEGEGAYRFRIDYEETTKSREIAQHLEVASSGKLQNYPNDYEIEIRIRPNTNQEGVIYLKLMTIEDHRFLYRQQLSASSMSSSTAALIAHYLQDYVKGDGQLLDPMCNDGTLLIERCLALPPHFVMGLDFNAELMQKAKQNANNAHVDIRFVQRDLKTFTHQRLFDEVITQLPSIRKKEDQARIDSLYQMVFRKVKELMNVGGIFAVYTSETNLVKQAYNKNRSYLQLKKQIPISGKRILYIFETLDTYTNNERSR